MLYWLDTEFIEDGSTIDLISIGVVAEDGREFYCLNLDCNHSLAGNWVRLNVLPYLPHKRRHNVARDSKDVQGKYTSHKRIGLEVLSFCDPVKYGKPEFWGYYADCQLFGRMIDLPAGFPKYCRDIKQLADDLGNPRLPPQTGKVHNALDDARWNKEAWIFMQTCKN